MVKFRGALLLGALLLGSTVHAQQNPDWTTPIAPFRIAGNLYYVGGKDLASYLIVTPQGDILINSGLESSVPLIRNSLEQLGFKFNDIKVLPGWRLVDRPDQPASYPGIAADYRRTFATLKALHCDIFLGAHGAYFGMLAKLDRIKAGAKDNVWVDPQGYRAAVAEREQAFATELKRQESQSAN